MQKEALSLNDLKADLRVRFEAEPQKAALAIMALESAQYAINEMARFGMRFEFVEVQSAPTQALTPAPAGPTRAQIDAAFARLKARLAEKPGPLAPHHNPLESLFGPGMVS